MKTQVFVIVTPAGEYYTGDLSMGRAVFSKDRDDAIELDADEVKVEMAETSQFPSDARVEVLYEFETKPEKPSRG